MKCIVLAGEERSAADRRLSGLFREWVCGERDGIAAFDGGFCGGGGDILLTQARRVERLPRGGIIVFRESFSERCRVDAEVRCAAVVSAENVLAVRLLSGMDAQTVTCGLSGKDTVTVTSFTGDAAMLALQRSVVACSGRVVQPFELPVRLGGTCDRYAIMSLFAAKLLTGELPRK